MDSVRSYVLEENQKDLIKQFLKQIFVDVKEPDYEELTELIATKLRELNTLRKNMEEFDEKGLSKIASEFDIDKEQIVDAFIYFSLIVENTLMLKQISILIEKIQDLQDQ